MRYAVTGDPAHLRVVENAYDFLQNTQCYATGGSWTRRKNHASRKPWQGARLSAQQLRNSLRIVGRVQDVTVPDAIHGKGAVWRLGRAAAL